MSGEEGTIYLLHFERPYKHARHYMGWTTDLEARLERHRQGSGARLLAVIADAGIGWELARTWVGTRYDERRLKRWGGKTRLCPICQRMDRSGAVAGADSSEQEQ